MDVVADFRRRRPQGWPARAALDLTDDPAILTAIANDIGDRGDLRAAGDRLRAARATSLLALSTSGNSRERDRGAGRGARGAGCARSRWSATTAGASPPRASADHVDRHALAAHPAHPGGAGAAPTTCCASWSSCDARGARRGARAIEGTVQGVGFRPYVYRLARRAGLGGYVLNDARGVLLEVEGRREARRALPRPAAGRGAAARGDRAVAWRAASADRRARASAIRRASAGRRARRAGHAGRRDLRRLPGRARSTRPTAATATRSSTAPTAARGSRSSAASRTTGR